MTVTVYLAMLNFSKPMPEKIRIAHNYCIARMCFQMNRKSNVARILTVVTCLKHC